MDYTKLRKNIEEKIKQAKEDVSNITIQKNEINSNVPRWWNFLYLTDKEYSYYMNPCYNDDDDESKLEDMLNYYEEKQLKKKKVEY